MKIMFKKLINSNLFMIIFNSSCIGILFAVFDFVVSKIYKMSTVHILICILSVLFINTFFIPLLDLIKKQFKEI